mgnify:FL=1
MWPDKAQFAEVLSPDDLKAVAELGEDAKVFLESDLGKSLLAAAEADALEAMEHLGATAPDDTKEIVRWQIELKAARKVREKIEQFIGLGDEALSQWSMKNEP